MMLPDLQNVLKFFHLCENLKKERRHGKTSDNEHDRVASHSWRMAMMVLILAPFLGKKFDVTKALKLALIHDLPEIITGDQTYFLHVFDVKAKELKSKKENMAMLELLKCLPFENRTELQSLWKDYEQQQSYEAQVVKALDKLEAQIQHNEADISVWNDFDKACYDSYLDKFCDFDQVLKLLKQLVQDESKEKLKNF